MPVAVTADISPPGPPVLLERAAQLRGAPRIARGGQADPSVPHPRHLEARLPQAIGAELLEAPGPRPPRAGEAGEETIRGG